MRQKICTKCKKLKDIDDFNKSKQEKDGYKYKCKDCLNRYGRERRKNATPEQKEKWKIKQRKYIKKYKEKNRESYNKTVKKAFNKWHSKKENRMQHNSRRTRGIDYKMERQLIAFENDAKPNRGVYATDEKKTKRVLKMINEHIKRKGYDI